MTKKVGRQKSKNTKSEQIKIRATKADKELLKECCKKLELTQYEIIMKGIMCIYEDITRKEMQ